MQQTSQTSAWLTPTAAAKLKEMAATTVEPILRLYVAGQTCCGVRFEIAFADDVPEGYSVTEVEGVRLIVDPGSQTYCAGATVDFIETPEGSGFRVDAPAAPTGTCGCGGH